MTIIRRITFITLMLACSVVLGSVQARSASAEFIGNPGYWVSGAFLQYYLAAEHPEVIFGDPISEQLLDPVNQQPVQYFENVRFELIESENGPVVQLTPLGKYLFDPVKHQKAAIAFDSSVCQRFENGMDVCYAFWQFYQNHNGTLYLGQPINGLQTNTSGFLVQYFDNGSLEWHPERQSGERVILTPSGRYYFERTDAALNQPVNDVSKRPSPLQSPPLARVFVANAILTANSNQIVRVVVKDAYQQPISGAVVGLTATMPDGKEFFFRLPETDSHGISTLELMVADFPPGSVVVLEALINTPDGTTTATSWFRLWW